MGVSNKHGTWLKWSQPFLEPKTPLYFYVKRRAWSFWHADITDVCLLGLDMKIGGESSTIIATCWVFVHTVHMEPWTPVLRTAVCCGCSEHVVSEQQYSKTDKCERNNLLVLHFDTAESIDAPQASLKLIDVCKALTIFNSLLRDKMFH